MDGAAERVFTRKPWPSVQSLITHNPSIFQPAVSFNSHFSMLPITFLLALIASASAVSIPSDNFNDVVAFASDPDIRGLPQIDDSSAEWTAPETGRDNESWSKATSNLDGIEDSVSQRKEAGTDFLFNYHIIEKINYERWKLRNTDLIANFLLASTSTTRAKLLAKNNCKFVSDINLKSSLTQNYYRAGSSGPLNQQALIDKWSKAKLKSIGDKSLRKIGCGTATGKNCRLTICTMSR
ncbi:hypothetical protein HDU67_001830 [Dinochytrium kinnereticum]|nr:hypothetical protein HDU67_001830 [Dinochytrium kinnereticum]